MVRATLVMHFYLSRSVCPFDDHHFWLRICDVVTFVDSVQECIHLQINKNNKVAG